MHTSRSATKGKNIKDKIPANNCMFNMHVIEFDLKIENNTIFCNINDSYILDAGMNQNS